MEETNPARRSSGVYDAVYGSAPGSASNVASRGHVAPSAGVVLADLSPADNPRVGPVPSRDPQANPAPDIARPRTPFYKKRWFAVSQIILVPVGIAMVFILLFPVVRSVVQLLVNKSTLNIQAVTISNPTNGSFTLSMNGNVARTGPIPATIRFTEPVTVAWVHDGSVTQIGTMQLQDPLKCKNSRATLNQTTTFNITDPGAFGTFSRYLITSKNFTWLLQSHNLRVNAVKFPVAKGISFQKYVILKGLDSFHGAVVLKDLQLPSDNPSGGINFVAVTELVNKSPFTLDLGTIVFRLQYQGVFLGVGTGNSVKLVNGANSVSLSGYLVRHDREADLTLLSGLFTNYLNGDLTPVSVIGQSTLLNDGSSVSWLSSGLQALTLAVPFKPMTPIDPIKAITIGNLALAFDARNAWAPTAQSNSVMANMKLPFGFNVSINEIRNDLNISKNGTTVAGFSTPLGASHSLISVLGPTDTEGNINITITNTTLIIPKTQHAAFSSFNAELTSSRTTEFSLVGGVHAVANTSIGVMKLGPIHVNVSTSLKGLHGLDETYIDSVDVSGGSADGINLNINVTMFNPSNLQLYIGNLTLHLGRNGAMLGDVVLRDLSLNIGNNSFVATSTFKPNGVPQGIQTLNDFVDRKDVALTISGFNGSTDVASLEEAMQSLHIDVILPGLKSNLLATASLTVLPTTGQNNISHVQVTLNNPFSADLHITHIKSTVSSFGIFLGVIDTGTDFHVAGKSSTKSPVLNLTMNLDPPALFTLTRNLAIEARLNVAPLDAIVALGGYHYLVPVNGTFNEDQSDLFNGFDLTSFIQAAFKQLKSDVHLKTTLSIGSYQTTIEFSQLEIPTATDSSLELLLPVLARPIVQSMVAGSTLGIDNILITSPLQDSFNTQLAGNIRNAGPFDANISFPSGLSVSWGGKILGHLQMEDVRVAGNVGATINTHASFTVADVAHLTDFTKVLLTQRSFVWVIDGENLTVTALGIGVSDISLSAKQVALRGFNGLKGGVQIETFDLPSNDPVGGIHLILQTTVANSAQVGIEINSITLNAVVGDTTIATVESSGKVLLAPASTSALSLNGRLVPQTTPVGLDIVSAIFNNFLHGIDNDIIIEGSAAGLVEVTWLNDGIKALKIETILPNRGVLSIINTVDINQMTLLFTSPTAYEPLTSSNSIDVTFQIPFGFPLDIRALEQTLTIGFEGTSIAQLKIPKGPSVTDVQRRSIHLNFTDVPFAVFSGQHPSFDHFLSSTTTGQQERIQISGSANVEALTAVGPLSLQNINFAVNSEISGLQGLDAVPPKIGQLDVSHGYPDYLLIKVNSTLLNPSILTVGAGDVSFVLQFKGQTVGFANLDKLIILPGNATYPISVRYVPQSGAISAGRTLLQNFLQGIDAEAAIMGTTDSTPIESLTQALSQIYLPVTIPALKENLVKNASLTFPMDVASTGIASVSFTLVNPFTANIDMLTVSATAQFHSLALGTIDNVDVSEDPIEARGHGSVTSPALPLKFNLDPSTIIEVVTIASKEKGIDLGPLAQLFQFVFDNPQFHPLVTTRVDKSPPTCNSGNQFDFSGTIVKALSGLLVNLGIQTFVKLDDFATDLVFQQNAVPVNVDDTALYLIGAVAKPITQHLVDGSILSFRSAIVTNISEDGFDLYLVGSLTNIGPLDALITFVDPLIISWNGQDIGQLQLDPICAAARHGVPDYRSMARLTITDESKFALFAVFLLHNPSFEWTISTKKLRVTALGTIFDNVSLSKTVSFKAFNGLPDVSISNFNLPSDDPAGGIHIEIDVTIPSPAQLGIDLGSVSFQSFYKEALIGPLLARNLSLAPQYVTTSHLSGRIVPQSGPNLDNMGQLFSTFLAGENLTLLAKGDTVIPPGANKTVKWLSEAFKTLELPIVLPGKQFNIIQSIGLNDLSVTTLSQEQAFAPPTSSSNTLAKYKNPFGFPLQVVAASQKLTLRSQGMDIAQLIIPNTLVESDISTGNLVDLRISFTDLPLISLNKGAFQQMFAAVTLQSMANIELRGAADVAAKTSIGIIPISGIPFDVTSQLKGIDAFDHTASLSNVSVTGGGGEGGSEYIVSLVTTTLENPSNVSLKTDDISLPVTYQGVMIGRAAMNSFDLHSGANVVQAEFRYQPRNANDTIAQTFLTRFIQTRDSIPLTIDGDYESSPYESLQPALAGIHISTSLEGLHHPNLITHINVYIMVATLATSRVSIDFDINNPLSTEIIIDFVQSDSGVNGHTYAQFSHSFQNFVIPAGSTVNSGPINNVLLTQGALGSLDIIPLGYLDIDAANTIRIGSTSGYQIPWLQIRQSRVPTTYQLQGVTL